MSDAAIGGADENRAFFQTIENSRENSRAVSTASSSQASFQRFPCTESADTRDSVRLSFRKNFSWLACSKRFPSALFSSRIVFSFSPMCQYSSEDGFANDWHLVHLGSRAVGRAALVFTEATAVTPEGRISPQDLGIWQDAHVDFLARIVRFLDSQGSVAGMQLAHAGRKASTAVPWKGGSPVGPDAGGWMPIWAPSPLAFAPGYQVPQQLNVEQIQQTVAAFKQAAQRALRAGFRVIEIHAAHGYLLHEFLSPLSNQRQDQYGGSFDNRVRLVCEVVAAVREVWPETLPLFVRISSTDWVEGGWDIGQSVELARRLKPLGVDFVDCSSGGLVPNAVIPIGPGYQTQFAERIRHEAEILTGTVGLITSPLQADTIIRTGQADAVLLAREFLRQPYWPLHAARAVHQKIAWPEQYERARD
ncbi:MAG TPA: NADH:flavin oxidoreductase/NADH oxidase [Terriglobales bacterium]|nr:NADH:flavin oxidoreductase/NADH oxidase [Terriglobales bacterium]